MINLKGHKVLKTLSFPRSLKIYTVVANPPSRCIHCDNKHIVGYGYRKERIIDKPFNLKTVEIQLKRRRYHCKSCKATFLEDVPEKHYKRQMTNRLVDYIESEIINRAFDDVAFEIGVDEKTIRNVYKDGNRQI